MQTRIRFQWIAAIAAAMALAALLVTAISTETCFADEPADESTYTSHIKHFKCGKIDFRKKIDRGWGTAIVYEKLAGKLKITPKKGWKVKKITVDYIIDNKSDFRISTKKVKNGARLKYSRTQRPQKIIATLQNKKTKETQTLQVITPL